MPFEIGVAGLLDEMGIPFEIRAASLRDKIKKCFDIVRVSGNHSVRTIKHVITHVIHAPPLYIAFYGICSSVVYTRYLTLRCKFFILQFHLLYFIYWLFKLVIYSTAD